MKLWENTALTEKGTALQNKLFDGQTLKITGAKAGAGEVPSVNLRQQTQITDERQEITLQPVRTEDGKAVIPVLLENIEVKESYELHQVGFMHKIRRREKFILHCTDFGGKENSISGRKSGIFHHMELLFSEFRYGTV